MSVRTYVVPLTSTYNPDVPTALGQASIALPPEYKGHAVLLEKDTAEVSVGAPQLVHVLNCVPTLKGWQSVGWVDDSINEPWATYTEYIGEDDQDQERALYPLGSHIFTVPLDNSAGTTRFIRHKLLCNLGDDSTFEHTEEISSDFLPVGLDSSEYPGAYVPTGNYLIPQIYIVQVGGQTLKIMNRQDVQIYAYDIGEWRDCTVPALDFSHSSSSVVWFTSTGYLLAAWQDKVFFSTALELFPEPFVGNTTTYQVGDIVLIGGMQGTITAISAGAATLPPANQIYARTGYTYGVVTWTFEAVELDFEPSDLTGAGVKAIEGVQGEIIAALPLGAGFVLYCSGGGAIVGQASNAVGDPFVYKTHQQVGAISRHGPDVIAHGVDQNMHYAVTTRGLQAVTSTGVKPLDVQLNTLLSKLWQKGDDTSVEYLKRAVVEAGTGNISLETLERPPYYRETAMPSQVVSVAGKYLLFLVQGHLPIPGGVDVNTTYVGDIYGYDMQLQRAFRLQPTMATDVTKNWAAIVKLLDQSACRGARAGITVANNALRYEACLIDAYAAGLGEGELLFGPFMGSRGRSIQINSITLHTETGTPSSEIEVFTIPQYEDAPLEGTAIATTVDPNRSGTAARYFAEPTIAMYQYILVRGVIRNLVDMSIEYVVVGSAA